MIPIVRASIVVVKHICPTAPPSCPLLSPLSLLSYLSLSAYLPLSFNLPDAVLGAPATVPRKVARGRLLPFGRNEHASRSRVDRYLVIGWTLATQNEVISQKLRPEGIAASCT